MVDDSPLVPRSSSDVEKRLVGTRSQRMWIWSVADETGQGEAVETGGGVFASGKGELEWKAENLLEIMAEFDWGSGCGDNFELEVGFGGVVQFEDMEKTEMRAGADAESVIVTEIVWYPQSLSGHLEKGCFEQGRDLMQRCLGKTGEAGWMRGESPLETTRKIF